MRLRGEYNKYIDKISQDNDVRKMEQYTQHGSVSTLAHCQHVAALSCRLSEMFHLSVNHEEMIRGALLHDYFLYDWHEYRGERLHGFEHPQVALENALRDFDLTEKEQNIIESHMWPLTLGRIPQSREAVLVCIADKLCSIKETLMER